jgi:hypothetical protein
LEESFSLELTTDKPRSEHMFLSNLLSFLGFKQRLSRSERLQKKKDKTRSRKARGFSLDQLSNMNFTIQEFINSSLTRYFSS